MIQNEAWAVVFGLGAAASWGASDFSGGLASKRNSVHHVILWSQLIGAVALLVFALLIHEHGFSIYHFLVGAAGGVCGVLGLSALYKGLSTGRMGVVAPVSAATTAVIPILVAAVTEGWPTWVQVLGFAAAIVGVWLLSSRQGTNRIQLAELYLPIMAGLGFGMFFITINHVSTQSVLWPLVGARAASILLMCGLIFKGGRPSPPRSGRAWGLIAFAGLLDTAGNVCFALATRAGRLDVSAVLSSLYPAITVLLAWVLIKEHLSRRQLMGLAAALAALVLMAG